MNRAHDHDQLLARLEGAASDLWRGSVVIYDVWVSDADGTHVRAAVHDLRGGCRLGSVALLARRPGSSWAA